MCRHDVLNCDDLKAITGYQRPGDVERCLRQQGVHVFYGKSGPWTTVALINKAGGLVQGVPSPSEGLDPHSII